MEYDKLQKLLAKEPKGDRIYRTLRGVREDWLKLYSGLLEAKNLAEGKQLVNTLSSMIKKLNSLDF